MICPLTLSNKVILEKEISVEHIVKLYLESLNINVSNYFIGTETIKIYKCLETGYRFYYPFHVAGDAKFYQTLLQFDWYYMDWKWEYEVAQRFIRPGEMLLEIGCGNGKFIKHISNEKQTKCIGLELNPAMARVVDKGNLMILNETIQNHAEKNKEIYHVVCSFQVLEHITEVNSFLESTLATLKKGGTLIVCVLNNDSFIKFELDKLNLPPHHMGLWNKSSLINLQKLFDIKLEKIIIEPLQPYNYEYYYDVFLNRVTKKSKLIARAVWKFKPIFCKKMIPFFANMIEGTSIMVIFKKI